MMTLSGVLLERDNDAAPTLRDMAVGLSRIPRFGGQTLLLWTVGQHLLACAAYVRMGHGGMELELDVLLHDAHEAMTSDIPTTWKTDDMRALQKTLDRRIYNAFGLSLPSESQAAEIGAVDRELLLAEAFWVAPTPTYERICVEMDRRASPEACEAVRQVLDWAAPPAEVADLWELRITQLLVKP